MSEATVACAHQLATLRLYGRLIGEREDWSGALVLCCGEGCVANGIPAAVSIAGGAALAIDADAGALKSAMRAGELDFVVNTLDEALRTLKNQIRQRRPLSVGLIADVPAALAEMVERGVLPELLLVEMDQSAQAILRSESIRALEAMGMTVRQANEPADERPATILLGKPRYETYLPAVDAAGLKAIDERLPAIFPADDIVRRRWVQRVGSYLREARSGGRWIWLSEEEQKQLASEGLLRAGHQSGPERLGAGLGVGGDG
jgi:hypothetical protein